MSILLKAVECGSLEKTRLLISVGADIDERNKYGDTLLHISSEMNHLNIAKALICAGWDVDARNKYGQTPLHFSALKGNVDILEYLIDAGAKVEAKDDCGETALHASSKIGHLKVVKALVFTGSDVNAKNEYERTPLHLISGFEGFVDIANVLVAYGADDNAKDVYGNTALHESSKMGHVNIVKTLINANADVNAKNKFGKTTLHYGAMNDSVEISNLLIDAGANINAKDNKKQTPLHYGSMFGIPDIVKLLISAGSDVTAKNVFGSTSFDEWDISERNGVFLVKYSLLYTHANKPSFKHNVRWFEEKWNLYETQAKKLKETFLGNSCVSVSKFLTETDENKLALYSSEENFGLTTALGRASYYEELLLYAVNIFDQFNKGRERADLLAKSQTVMKKHIYQMLPIEIIIKITDYLKNEDLKNFLSNTFFQL